MQNLSLFSRSKGSGPSVLLVERDNDIRDIIRYILTEAGFNVAAFSSCPSADDIRDMNPSTILLDEVLTCGCRESKLCQYIKQDESIASLPLLLLTTNCRAAEIAHVSGADDFLQKPFDINDLTRKVIRWSIARLTGHKLLDSRSCYV